MTAIALTPEGEAFLARVRDELADLPPDERDELLEDIESHLAEVAGEGGVGLAARLGSAEEFAQELRNSAGLPPRAATAFSRLDRCRSWIDGSMRWIGSLREQFRAVHIWWVVRGSLLAVAVAVVIGQLGDNYAWGHAHAWLPHAGLRGEGAAVALAAFVILSLGLGRLAAGGRGGHVDRAASAVALIAIVPAAWHLDSPPRAPIYSTVPSPNMLGLRFNGTPVGNIFPFDASGQPLDDVLLYRSNGQALNVDAYRIDPKRRYLVAPNGRRLYNSFPVRFYTRNTQQVAKGWIRPSVHIPKLQIPPLGDRTP
jgi:hypothetical protein